MVQKDNQKIAAIGISIFLSLLLWIYVMGEQNPVQTRVIDNVKVSLENTDNITRNNLVLIPKQDYTVSISVRGRIKDLLVVRSEDIKLEADMGDTLKKGDNSMKVNIKSLPKGITLTGEEIPKVNVKLDSLATRYVPIQVVVTGEAKPGYEYIKPVVEPSGVMISGAKSYVDEVEKVIGKINITGIDTKVTKTISLEPVNSGGKVMTNVSIEPKFVDITVEVAPYKEVPIKVKTTGVLKDGYTMLGITPKIPTVKIIGSKDVLDRINYVDTDVFDISKLTQTITKEIKLRIPSGVTTKSDIKSVGIEFKINQKASKELVIGLITKGKLEGFSYELNISSVTVKVTGDGKSMTGITAGDLECVIDVSTLKEGDHTVDVNAKLKVPGEVILVSPGTVLIKVKKIS